MKKGEIDIITLGCSKNLVDAERLMYQLHQLGYTCVHDSDKPRGEIAVINTCGFIGDAKEESISVILQFAERKKKRQLRKLYVMGCLSERYMADLEEELPEVDRYFGKFNYMELIQELADEKSAKPCAPFMRTLTTPSHYAYVKISEGCNRFCSYCAIPLITGRHTSRPMDEILDEVRWLVSQGVKEFQIIAQDLSSYGMDIASDQADKHLLPELIERMAEIDGVRWIRLHYAYPSDFPMDLLRVMREHPNVCKYLDLALQHSTDHMLGMMRRHISSDEQKALLRTIREQVPGIHIRTTLMVGHPGETEADFEELMAFTKEMRFERMGAFAYSDEDGTYANKHYSDDIPQEVKQERLDRLMALQEGIATEINEAKRGQILTCIVDRQEGDYWVGRTEYDSPEVDCEVLITSNTSLEIGEMYEIEITQVEGFDLWGVPANPQQ